MKTLSKDIYYKSNRGRGPGVARYVSRVGDVVWLERKASPRARRWILFCLPVQYLESNACGWKRVKSGNWLRGLTAR